MLLCQAAHPHVHQLGPLVLCSPLTTNKLCALIEPVEHALGVAVDKLVAAPQHGPQPKVESHLGVRGQTVVPTPGNVLCGNVSASDEKFAPPLSHVVGDSQVNFFSRRVCRSI